MSVKRGCLSGLSRSKTGAGRLQGQLQKGIKAAVPLISFFALAACAIHPVQQDVTGVPTVAIINHIRCETRLAIQDKAIEMLRKHGKGYSLLADQLESIRGQIWVVNPYTQLDAVERAFYFRYIQTGIAYDFTLGSTEDNKAVLMVDPIRLITNGMASANLNSSGEFSRDNSRRFVVSETFAKLLGNKISDCDDKPLDKNFAYPVAGSIGMAELISTFIDLNQDDTLKTIPSGSGVFGDTLTFLTILSGTASPTVQITPVGHKFGLASPTNFTASVTRTDKHILSIGLSMAADNPKPVGAAAKPTVVPTSAYRNPSALQKSSGVTDQELRALEILTQLRLDSFLDRATFATPAAGP